MRVGGRTGAVVVAVVAVSLAACGGGDRAPSAARSTTSTSTTTSSSAPPTTTVAAADVPATTAAAAPATTAAAAAASASTASTASTAPSAPTSTTARPVAASRTFEGVIVVGASIDGIAPGNTTGQVQSAVGPPQHTQAGKDGVVRWDYPDHNSLTVTFDPGGHVITVFVSGLPGQAPIYDHTDKGIGLLSSMGDALAAYPDNCFPPDADSGAPPSCDFRGGGYEMQFLASGRYGTGLEAPVETILLKLLR